MKRKNLTDVKRKVVESSLWARGEFINTKEKAHYSDLKKHMTPEEFKYMCTYMWRLGYATAIKETGAKVPEHRRVYEKKELN